MVVILLLFRVLTRKPESVSICPTEAHVGGGAGLLSDKRADSHAVFHDPPSSWTRGATLKSTRPRATLRESPELGQ